MIVLMLPLNTVLTSSRNAILIEAGTRLIVEALMCPYRMSERVRAKYLLRSVTQGMLLMWDRGLH